MASAAGRVVTAGIAASISLKSQLDREERDCMGVSRAPLLIVTAYFVGCTLASAEEACPAAPFETDVGKIAAAIAAQPLEPLLSDASGPPSGTPESERLTDGAVWTSAGGLGAHSAVSLDYDAKRYLIVHVLEDWPSRDVYELNVNRHHPNAPSRFATR